MKSKKIKNNMKPNEVTNPHRAKETKKANKYLPLILILGLVVIAIVSWVVIHGIVSKTIIKDDIESKLAFLHEGNIEWVNYTKAPVSNEILEFINKSSKPDGEVAEDYITTILKNADISYEVGFVMFDSCKVSFTCNGYSFTAFLDYCKAKEAVSKEDIVACLKEYLENSNKEYTGSTELEYKNEDGGWICDYSDPGFLDMITCGMLTAYGDYYQKSLDNINDLISYISNQEQSGNDE